jgi:FixJ family two-component response regulator
VDRLRRENGAVRRLAPRVGFARRNGHRATVAVLDADRDVRKAFARLLRTDRYRVLTFRSLDEFLASCFPTTADCLVLDVRLSGAHEREQLTALLEYPPMIFVSADETDVAAARELKTRRRVVSLPKPCEGGELLAAVADGVAHRADSFERFRSASS